MLIVLTHLGLPILVAFRYSPSGVLDYALKVLRCVLISMQTRGIQFWHVLKGYNETCDTEADQ